MIKYSAFLVSALMFVACKTPKDNKVMEKGSIYKTWELSVLDGIKRIDGQRPVFLELSKDGKVSGFSGCNLLNGTITVEDGGRIKFNNLASTRMACPEKQMTLEKEVLDMLSTTDNYTMDGGKLYLNVGRRAPLAVFYEKSDQDIVNKYWKLKELGGKPVKMSENQEREQYFILRSDHTISGFAGCNHFNGEYKLHDKNRIRVNENLAVTMKACPDEDINEYTFLEVFRLADHYTINGDVLHLKSGKKPVLAIFEAVYF